MKEEATSKKVVQAKEPIVHKLQESVSVGSNKNYELSQMTQLFQQAGARYKQLSHDKMQNGN